MDSSCKPNCVGECQLLQGHNQLTHYSSQHMLSATGVAGLLHFTIKQKGAMQTLTNTAPSQASQCWPSSLPGF